MSSLMQVPFLDLKTQYVAHKAEFDSAIEAVLERTAFAGGPFVEEFEKAFASFCDCSRAVGLGSGTEALWLALLALDIGPHDEVITVPNTFIATAEAISFCGARALFVDVDKRTHTMDPELLASAISPRTRAIIPVHLFGQTADMDPILEVAARHDLPVIEDACQAHGAMYKGRTAGSMGVAGCFSFYPTKNLGAFGEAGALVTSDDKLADKVRMLRDHGQSRKYEHKYIGWNSRMDGIQAAVLSVKLNYLQEANEARRRNARMYDELLDGIEGVVPPWEADYSHHIYHVYAVRAKNRDTMLHELGRQGIGCGIHYPKPVHLQEAYSCQGTFIGDFPIAESAAGEFISLPMFPELSAEQISYVTNVVKQTAEACQIPTTTDGR